MSLKTLAKIIPHNIKRFGSNPPIAEKSKSHNRKIYTKSPIFKISSHQEIPFYASSFKGTYTIEAAIAMPLFITMMVFCIFIFRIFQVQYGVQQAIDISSRSMAVTLGNLSNIGESDRDVEVTPEDVDAGTEISNEVLLATTIARVELEIKNKNVPTNFVDGGCAGFNLLETNVEGNYIDIKVNYTMTFPVGLLGEFSFDVSQRAKNRKWIGYDKSENMVDEAYVYITEHGEVYHSNINCTYLRPSVHRVSTEDLATARNNSGAIYYECQRCKNKNNNGCVFLTDYGTAFHNDVNCTEIKHNITKVTYESVKDTMRPCSKCGQIH